jgi:3,4-dihydroxy 2-butanone 4-phosphate synthase/GTP cyclohydrolase II
MFARIEELAEEIRAGRMVVLVDDEHRENEGDLVLAAEHATAEAINFMLAHGRGILCLALTEERCRQLELPLMERENRSRFGTAFTVSIDAADGITTGTSAYDRARTIRTAVADGCRPSDLVRPGHVFPIMARPGGVLVRAGHTEASVDLARIAGLKPAAVICEILDEDGSMMRLPRLQEFAARHGLKIGTIADLIAYRRAKGERLIEKVAAVNLPTRHGRFRLHCYRSLVDDYLHLALCAGDVGEEFAGATLVQEDPVLVRVHSECLTGDIFHSLRCDCGDQTEQALRKIAEAGRGVFLYIRQEGRGIGLVNKLKSYALQDQGLDTVEANQRLGFPPDLREYGIGAQILHDLGVRKMRLMTNNPRKIISIRGFGLEVVERVPIEAPVRRENAAYLRAKKEKMGHWIEGMGECPGQGAP